MPPCSQPVAEVVVRIRVDGEEVEPAVVVDVDPADAAAHHRGHVHRRPRAEGVLLEVDPDRRGDVLEVGAADAGGDELGRRAGRDRLGRAAARADDDVARPVELELERARERRRRCPVNATAAGVPWKVTSRSVPVAVATTIGGSWPTAVSSSSWSLSTWRSGTMIALRPGGADLLPRGPAAACRPPPLAARVLSRVRSASASIRRSATRSPAICRASFGSICVATPFEGSTVSCGSVARRSGRRAGDGRLGPRRDAGEHEHAGEHRRAGERQPRRAGSGRGRANAGRRRGASTSTSGRAAQTIQSAPSSATFVQNSVICGAISSTASSATATRVDAATRRGSSASSSGR